MKTKYGVLGLDGYMSFRMPRSAAVRMYWTADIGLTSSFAVLFVGDDCLSVSEGDWSCIKGNLRYYSSNLLRSEWNFYSAVGY